MSNSRQLVRAATLVSLAYIASRVLGLARGVMLAALLNSAERDAYFAAFRVPDFIFELIAGGALGSAFIPTFAAYFARGEASRAQRFASAIINLVFVVVLISSAVAAWFAPWLASNFIARGFAAEQQLLVADLMRIMLVSTVIFGVSGIVMGMLNAQQHFLAPALAPIIYNLGIIGGALFLTPQFGVSGVAFGVVGGALGHLLIQIPALWQRQFRWQPTLNAHDEGVREVLRLMGPRVAGIALVHLNFFVNTTLASALGGGAISALEYARLLMLLPHGVIAQAIATTVFPTFATQVAQGDLPALRATSISVLRALLFFILPATVGLFVAREPLITWLLQRGKFAASDVTLTAYALQFYAPALAAYAITEILTRAFYALHDTRTPVIIGGATIALNIALSWALIGVLGVGGLALANLSANVLEAVGLLWLLQRRLGGLDGLSLARAVWPMLLAALLMGAAVSLFLWLMANGVAWLNAIGSLVIGAALYIGASWALQVNELLQAQQILGRRLKFLRRA